jgi:cysteinyl-tRNA synthetase
MITINGQKMGKSLGNFINLEELFDGSNKLLEQAYSPMTIRFFVLQAHYRSPLDFSNEGLKAAEKGLKKLQNAGDVLNSLQAVDKSTSDIAAVKQSLYDAMNDDMNTAIVIANLFEAVRIINSVKAGTETISKSDLESLKEFFPFFTTEILGLKNEDSGSGDEVGNLMSLIIDIRNNAKLQKDFATSDRIRKALSEAGFEIKDEKGGTTWGKS